MEVGELYFQDGTVVVRVEEKLFRLHAGLLAARSPVFRQVLENKNEENRFVGISLSVDISGVPLITLQDAAHDAHNFFLALYDPGFFEAPPANASLNCVLGILKTSTKYQVKALRRRALGHLNLTFPLSLNEWDTRINLSTISVRRDAFTSLSFCSTFEGAITIVKIAKAVNVPWIIPAALYECCAYDVDHILSHSAWDDGSIEEDTKKSIILGTFRHREGTSSVLRFLVAPPAQECNQKETCSEIRRNCNDIYAGGFPTTNPLSIWEDGDWEAYLDGMCSPCHEMCWKMHDEARKKFWKELPELYGLKSWTMLTELYHTEMAA